LSLEAVEEQVEGEHELRPAVAPAQHVAVGGMELRGDHRVT
jgi:hypothetical protein